MTSTAPPATGHELSDRVHALVNETATVLDRLGRADFATGLRQEATRAAATPTVVVAGETKRGKSSLVNALLSRPGLSPVAPEVATSSYILFRHGPAPSAAVHLAARDDAQPVRIDLGDLDELAEWATAEANPDNRKGVAFIEVTLDHPLLEHLCLIDTPGMGGLEQGYAELTLQALRRADALLFVLDAAAPISAPELAFLEQAAKRLDTVLLALTKIDLYQGWETILRDDAALLAERASRLAGCPVAPVSNRLAEVALALGADPESGVLRTEAGIGTVESLLSTQVVHRADAVRLSNIVRLALHLLGNLERAIKQRQAATDTGTNAKATLDDLRSRSKQLIKKSPHWRQQLDSAIQRVGLTRQASLAQGMEELKLHYSQLAVTSRSEEADALAARLTADVAALADRLWDDSCGELTGRVEQLLRAVDETATLGELIEAPPIRLTAFDTGSLVALGSATRTGDRLMALSSMAAPGALLGMLQIPLSGPVGPLLAALGATWGMLTLNLRREQSKRIEFRTWIHTAMASYRDQVGNRYAQSTIDVREQLQQLLDEQVHRRQEDLAETMTAAEQAAREEPATTARRRAATASVLRTVQTLQHDGEALLVELRPPQQQHLVLPDGSP